MKLHDSYFLMLLAFASIFQGCAPAAGKDDCPITKAPDPPFTPPAGYPKYRSPEGVFLLGTPGLWTLVTPRWKSPPTFDNLWLFSEHFVFGKSDHNLTLVARHLDNTEPLVWSTVANVALRDPSPFDRDPRSNSFVTVPLRIPTSGCWEITARYTHDLRKIDTLTYTVWVETQPNQTR